MKLRKLNQYALAVSALIVAIGSALYAPTTRAQAGGAAPQSTKGAVRKGPRASQQRGAPGEVA